MMTKTKRHFLLVMLLASLFSLPLMAAQEKKPTLMILPSDNWCAQRYFTTTFQNQGVQTVVPDYPTAFREDTELGGVISKVGELLTGLGYSLKDCEQEFKAMPSRMAEENVAMSKTGASLVESPLDMLKRRTKSDIIIQIGWQVNKESNGHSVTFAMEAFDAYTSKRIATASGTSNASQEIVPVLLENAVMQKITDFDTQMTQYYADLQANGREIVMIVRCWDSWENDLETEYNGEELLDCIQNWLNNNTINSAFNLTDATETMAQFEQIRIPFFDENGKAMDARAFATRLRKYLQQQYQITAKVMVRGLGEANIILGEK